MNTKIVIRQINAKLKNHIWNGTDKHAEKILSTVAFPKHCIKLFKKYISNESFTNRTHRKGTAKK